MTRDEQLSSQQLQKSHELEPHGPPRVPTRSESPHPRNRCPPVYQGERSKKRAGRQVLKDGQSAKGVQDYSSEKYVVARITKRKAGTSRCRLFEISRNRFGPSITLDFRLARWAAANRIELRVELRVCDRPLPVLRTEPLELNCLLEQPDARSLSRAQDIH